MPASNPNTTMMNTTIMSNGGGSNRSGGNNNPNKTSMNMTNMSIMSSDHTPIITKTPLQDLNLTNRNIKMATKESEWRKYLQFLMNDWMIYIFAHLFRSSQHDPNEHDHGSHEHVTVRRSIVRSAPECHWCWPPSIYAASAAHASIRA